MNRLCIFTIHYVSESVVACGKCHEDSGNEKSSDYYTRNEESIGFHIF